MTDASDLQNSGVEDEKYARYRRTELELVDAGLRIDRRRRSIRMLLLVPAEADQSPQRLR